MLGDNNGAAVTVKVTSEGRFDMPVPRLTKAVRFDLSVSRDKELLDIAMDSFAVVALKGSFFAHIGGDTEDLKCTIDKCLSVDVKADRLYISNDERSGGYAEIWVFKI